MHLQLETAAVRVHQSVPLSALVFTLWVSNTPVFGLASRLT
jgi:hypothetical protein